MYKPTDLMNQSSDDLYVGLVKQKTEKQSHNKNTTYITFEEVSGTYRMNRRADYNYTMNSSLEEVIVHIGQKGDIGPQGPAGPHGSMGYCPETICPPIDMSSFKGIQGETGSSEWCDRSCKTIDGMIGLKGIKGLKGDMGDTLILSFSKALQLIKYTINITSSNYFPKGQKGDKGERIQRKLIQRSIYTQNNRNIHRRKRQQQHDYDHLNLRIHPLQENKKRVKRSFMNSLNQSTNDSSILFTGSSFANFEKQKILGVKIFHHPNEFKTISSILPVGALVVTELPNHEILSLINDDHLSKWDFNKEIQWNPVNSLGLFMKIENIHNTWKRLHVKFGQEVTFGQHHPNLQIYNSSSSKESSSKINTPRHKEKIVFAFHPVPLTGGSFSGWHGANKKCHETALHHLGIPDFKVLLVDRNFPIERHIKWQYQHVPIINLGSQTVFTKWRDFLYGIRSNTNVPLYDLYGMPDLKVHSKKFWLGGGATFGCDEWTTDSSTKFGLTWSFDYRIGQVKINYEKCDSINYLMCYKIMKSTIA
uniref:Endostatin domain-containing protein n=1 Tax=Schistosoma mansoni TaxID=6183 RepID=A0A5K4FCY8_SCHMA